MDVKKSFKSPNYHYPHYQPSDLHLYCLPSSLFEISIQYFAVQFCSLFGALRMMICEHPAQYVHLQDII